MGGIGGNNAPRSGCLSGFWPSFRPLTNDLVPLGPGDQGTGGATGGFSSYSRRLGRCAEVGNNLRQAPTDLGRGDWPVWVLPREARGLDEVASERELIMDGADNYGPQLRLLWRAKRGIQPKEVVFVEVYAVFYAKPWRVESGQVGQRR